MATTKNKKSLRRYTDLPALIHMLTHRKITFLDPSRWEDRGDAYYLQLYKVRNRMKTVLALCFTQEPELYQHWLSFAGFPGGVCIQFQRRKLLDLLKSVSGVSMGEVGYPTLGAASKRFLSVTELPFRKRYAYLAEREYRAIYESAGKKLSFFDVEIPLSCIRIIRFSPWTPEPLAMSSIKHVKEIDGCGGLDLRLSKLFDNPKWNRLGDKAK